MRIESAFEVGVTVGVAIANRVQRDAPVLAAFPTALREPAAKLPDDIGDSPSGASGATPAWAWPNSHRSKQACTRLRFSASSFCRAQESNARRIPRRRHRGLA
jgi:hypothetical protein